MTIRSLLKSLARHKCNRDKGADMHIKFILQKMNGGFRTSKSVMSGEIIKKVRKFEKISGDFNFQHYIK